MTADLDRTRPVCCSPQRRGCDGVRIHSCPPRAGQYNRPVAPCQGNLLTQAAGATKRKTPWLGHGQSQNVFTIISSRVVLTRGPLYHIPCNLCGSVSPTHTSNFQDLISGDIRRSFLKIRRSDPQVLHDKMLLHESARSFPASLHELPTSRFLPAAGHVRPGRTFQTMTGNILPSAFLKTLCMQCSIFLMSPDSPDIPRVHM